MRSGDLNGWRARFFPHGLAGGEGAGGSSNIPGLCVVIRGAISIVLIRRKTLKGRVRLPTGDCRSSLHEGMFCMLHVHEDRRRLLVGRVFSKLLPEQ